MFRQLKVWFLVALLMATVKPVFGFALLGPGAVGNTPADLPPDSSWQVEALGYEESAIDPYGPDVGTPRNIAEGYRWNTPVLYYAVDANFVKYFGTNGATELDKAFNIINTITTNSLSSYSPMLTELPVNTIRDNPTASALNLVDLKSRVMNQMMEELGLAQPVRWTWCLHDRFVGPAGCPAGVSYAVIQRNFDPTTFVPTSFVNGLLYTYRIGEDCGGAAVTADAYEIPVDPFSSHTAVADYGLFLGEFYTALTRDDVGGLRYLMGSNNVVYENVDPSAELVNSTNTVGGGGAGSGETLETLSTSNLADLVQFSLTNNPIAVSNAFPGLIITSWTTGFRLVVSSNFFAFFTTDPYAPAGTFIVNVGETFTTNVQQIYSYTFGNIITNTFFPTEAVTVATTNVVPSPYAPAGSGILATNVSVTTTYEPLVSGDYYLLPNPNCGFDVLSNLLTTVIPETTIIPITNSATLGNPADVATVTTYFTNHLLAVLVTPCGNTNGAGGVTNSAGPAVREGIDHIQFVRGSYDSLIGQTWTPITNTYTITTISNGAPFVQIFRRTVTQPDFLFTADDLDGTASGPANTIFRTLSARTPPNFVHDPVLPNSGQLSGPGIIQILPSRMVFNNSGPIFTNSSPFLMDELSQVEIRNLGSFDGTTNPPTVYPDGTSLQSYENELLMSITPPTLPDGEVGAAYSVQIGGTGGQPPYTFSLASGSAGLPTGLVFTNNMITGTNRTEGIFDFSLQMTDSSQRTVQSEYSITVTNAP